MGPIFTVLLLRHTGNCSSRGLPGPEELGCPVTRACPIQCSTAQCEKTTIYHCYLLFNTLYSKPMLRIMSGCTVQYHHDCLSRVYRTSNAKGTQSCRPKISVNIIPLAKMKYIHQRVSEDTLCQRN
jgi:hypothetical protein